MPFNKCNKFFEGGTFQSDSVDMIPQSDDLRVQHSCHDVVVVMRDVSEQDNVAHKLGDDHSKSKKGEQNNGLLLPGGSKLQSSIGSFFSTLYISTESSL